MASNPKGPLMRMTRRGQSGVPRTGQISPLGARLERLTSLEPPAHSLKFKYKPSGGDPRPVSDRVGTAPVSMAPKRQVRAQTGEHGRVSDSVATAPVSMAPKYNHISSRNSSPSSSPNSKSGGLSRRDATPDGARGASPSTRLTPGRSLQKAGSRVAIQPRGRSQ